MIYPDKSSRTDATNTQIILTTSQLAGQTLRSTPDSSVIFAT